MAPSFATLLPEQDPSFRSFANFAHYRQVSPKYYFSLKVNLPLLHLPSGKKRRRSLLKNLAFAV